ncbi:MAG TPA: hypothetical protein VIW27_01715 [Gammaproteobacteria bacterium]|jgi:hypothetical protein
MKKLIVLGFSLLFFTTTSHAIDFGVGAKAGLNGLGLDLTVGLTKNVNLRLSAAAIDIDNEEETVTVGDPGAEGDIAAELEFDYGARAAFIDWHVFGGGFRLSAGMYRNTGAVDLSGTLTGDVIVDGTPVAVGDLGTISGEVELADSYQPYLGIGWGRGAGGDGGLSFSVDLGVAVLEPSVSLDATVTATSGLTQAELDDALRGMEQDAEEDLEDLELWPVFAIGLNYAF